MCRGCNSPSSGTNPSAPCHGGPSACPPAPCSAEKVKQNLAACDGGTGAWAGAKSVIGKDPQVRMAPTSSGFDAETDTTSGTVTIKPTTDCCDATASLFFELSNVRNTPAFNKVDADAAAGNLSREDYTIANEKIEYQGVLNLKKTFAACRKSWGCAPGATSGYEGVSDDFDTYYRTQLAKSHKDHYRTGWDGSYKSAYEAKHP